MVTQHFAIGDYLVSATLEWLPQNFWPKYGRCQARLPAEPRVHAAMRTRSSLTEALGAEAARLRKLGVAAPYVYVELHRWLPDWAPLSRESREELEDEDAVSDKPVAKEIKELARQIGTKKTASKPTMSLATWHAAWSR